MIIYGDCEERNFIFYSTEDEEGMGELEDVTDEDEWAMIEEVLATFQVEE